jgi:hypothetical protein
MRLNPDSRFYCKKCAKIGIDEHLCGMRKKLGPKIKVDIPEFIDLEKGRQMRMFRPSYREQAMNGT